MIKPLTKDEFINIATNGIVIKLYENFIEDYIQNLIKFIEQATQDYYVSDFDCEWCEISIKGVNVLKVCYEKNKINFYLTNSDMTEDFKRDAGNAIKIVYMHSVAWEAINDDGKISHQPYSAWPI